MIIYPKSIIRMSIARKPVVNFVAFDGAGGFTLPLGVGGKPVGLNVGIPTIDVGDDVGLIVGDSLIVGDIVGLHVGP